MNSPPTDATIFEAIRGLGPATWMQTPPGRVAISREQMLLVLGIPPDDSASLDEQLEEHGGDLLAYEMPDPESDGQRRFRRRPPPLLFYVVPESWVD